MAEEKSYRDMLVEMRSAHYKAYENLIKVLNQDLEEEAEEDGKLKLNEDKIKAYADGIYKASTTLELIKDKIKKIDAEIAEIDGDGDNPKEEKKESEKTGHGMNSHLE